MRVNLHGFLFLGKEDSRTRENAEFSKGGV